MYHLFVVDFTTFCMHGRPKWLFHVKGGRGLRGFFREKMRAKCTLSCKKIGIKHKKVSLSGFLFFRLNRLLSKHHLIHPPHKQRLHRHTYAHEKLGVHVGLLEEVLDIGHGAVCAGGKPDCVVAAGIKRLAQEMACVEVVVVPQLVVSAIINRCRNHGMFVCA